MIADIEHLDTYLRELSLTRASPLVTITETPNTATIDFDVVGEEGLQPNVPGDLDLAAPFTKASVFESSPASVSITLQKDDATLVVVSQGPGSWTFPNPSSLVAFYPALAQNLQSTFYTTEDLTTELPSVDSARCRVTLDKSGWPAILAADSQVVAWAGISRTAFLNWVKAQDWHQAALRVFRNPWNLVVIDDWGRPISDSTKRLTVCRPDSIELKQTNPLPAWPEAAASAYLYAIDNHGAIADDQATDAAIFQLMALSALWLLCEDRDELSGVFRPSRRDLVSWSITPRRQFTRSGAGAVVALARWVLAQSNTTRLAIARRVAAKRIPDCYNGPERDLVTRAADISYAYITDRSVEAAMRAQIELESKFLAVTDKIAALSESLRDSVDQTTLRTLTAVLGIAVASLTVAQVRGWPTLASAILVAAYVAFTANYTLGSLSSEMTQQMDAVSALVKRRPPGAADDALDNKIAQWKCALEKKINADQNRLRIATGIIVVAAAVFAYLVPLPTPATGHGNSSQSTPTPTSVTPSITPTITASPTRSPVRAP